MLIPTTALAAPRIEGIHLGDSASDVRITLSGKAGYKIIHVEPREFMVAFNRATLSKNVQKTGVKQHAIQQVRIESLPNNVVALVFQSQLSITDVIGDWSNASNELLLQLTVAAEKPVITSAKQAKAAEEDHPSQEASNNLPRKAEPKRDEKRVGPETELLPNAGKSPSNKAVLALPAFSQTRSAVTAHSTGSKTSGGLDGLLDAIMAHECRNTDDMRSALALCEQKKWQEAFNRVHTQFPMMVEGTCQEPFYFLHGYLNYKMNTQDQEDVFLDGVTFFQDAISYFPDSPYVPYAMLGLGKTFQKLDNFTEAKGYFKIVLKDYPEHAGCPEAMYALGQIYTTQKKIKDAIETYKQFLKQYPKSPFVTAVKIALGKELYESDEYTAALSVLEEVVADHPDSILQNKDLAMIIGNLHYQLGHFEDARRAFIQTVNLYPGRPDTSILIARIADTYKDSNHPEKADKLYQFVMTAYPGTDGFAISAIRHAAFLSTRYEKERVYRKIIKDFKDHPMAKLAMVKLADLYYQADNYKASINTLRKIGGANLRELKNEAAFVLESSFEKLFSQLSQKNDFTGVIAAYEKDKQLVHRFENPEIFEMVGAAFLEGYLYDQAAVVLKRAYKLTRRGKRSASLYYRLGVAHQEIGKTSQAKEFFYAYIGSEGKDQIKPAAYLRLSQLLVADNAHDEALHLLKSAFTCSQTDSEKIDILIRQANLLRTMGQLVQVPSRVVQAINLLAESKEHRFSDLKNSYQLLGETYLSLSAYDKAVDAFTMALKFTESQRPPGLLFSLADSYQKALLPERARAVLTEILGSGDEFWARVAKEELNTMALSDRLSKS